MDATTAADVVVEKRGGWQHPIIGANTCFLRAQQRKTPCTCICIEHCVSQPDPAMPVHFALI